MYFLLHRKNAVQRRHTTHANVSGKLSTEPINVKNDGYFKWQRSPMSSAGDFLFVVVTFSVFRITIISFMVHTLCRVRKVTKKHLDTVLQQVVSQNAHNLPLTIQYNLQHYTYNAK